MCQVDLIYWVALKARDMASYERDKNFIMYFCCYITEVARNRVMDIPIFVATVWVVQQFPEHLQNKTIVCLRTHMQFLAARSRWTNLFMARYLIPLAI